MSAIFPFLCLVLLASATFAQATQMSKEKTPMKPIIVTADEKKIIGVETRTTNRAEADPKNAKIGALWQKFFQVQDKIPNKKRVETILGTYTKYESDHTGEYSLIVSSEVTSLNVVPDGMVGMTIPSARYMVFTAKGQMPAALIETWKSVWEYFSKNPEYKRAYTTDFEMHEKKDPTKVDIYIAIK
jgi:predicted transcriptional regulator YdeE